LTLNFQKVTFAKQSRPENWRPCNCNKFDGLLAR